MPMYNILIVDDHPIVRKGIAALIETESDLRVCGETGNGNEVLGLIRKTKPDAVILDLSLDGADGLSVIGQIKARFPKLAILIVSMHNELLYAHRCILAGARGYLMKGKPPREILRALRRIIEGDLYLSNEVRDQIVHSVVDRKCTCIHAIDKLSPREFQVFRLYGTGMQTKKIADKLNCSPKTIETHCLRIRKKLNLRDLTELIANAGAYFGVRG